MRQTLMVRGPARAAARTRIRPPAPALPQECLATLIADARASIRGMWEELHCAGAGPAEFPAISDAGFSDELLTAHEAYAARVGARVAMIRPILKVRVCDCVCV